MSDDPSYNPKACCGIHCWAYNAQGEHGKCMGNVRVIDSMGDDPEGSELWVHSCEAHIETWKKVTA